MHWFDLRPETPRGGLNSIHVLSSGEPCRSIGYVVRPSSCYSPGAPFWTVSSNRKPAPKEHRDPLKVARYYQSLMDSGKFESRAALARYLGVSRARMTQALRRLG
jgi:hypothetical protein